MFMGNFFKAAEKAGIKPLSLLYSVSDSLNIKIFNGEVEEYTSASDAKLEARGIYQGKFGAFVSDRTDPKVADMVMEKIKQAAVYGQPGDADLFVMPGAQFRRNHGYNKDTAEVKPEELIELGKKINEKIHAQDPRIQIVQVDLEKKSASKAYLNSNKVKAKGKSDYIALSAFLNVVDGKDIESDYEYCILSNLKGFDADKFAVEAAQRVVSKLGAEPVKSGKYNVVFSPDCVVSLLNPLLSMLSSFTVNQHLSLLEGKIGKQVVSKKISIKENPWADNPFASSFDDEGTPSQRKDLFTKGVLKTYLYDIEDAKKEGKVSTGNGVYTRGVIRPSAGFTEVKAGKKSVEELAAQVKNGLYIDSLEGIGTGLSRQSLNYSLQASGYIIENGKIGKPVTLITVAGNVLKDFGNVISIGNDSKLTYYGIQSPSVAIRKLAISGK